MASGILFLKNALLNQIDEQNTMDAITIVVNGATHTTAAQTTLRTLLEQLSFADKRIAVELNGEIVPRSQHETTHLQQGDRLEIVVAVGGG